MKLHLGCGGNYLEDYLEILKADVLPGEDKGKFLKNWLG